MMRKLFDGAKRRMTLLLPLLCALVAVVVIFNINKYRTLGYIRYDTGSYYAYLPALLHYQDFSLRWMDDFSEADKNSQRVYYKTAPNGNRVLKMTSGYALCNLLPYLMAEGLANLFFSPHNGYTWIHELMLALNAVFFLFLGLYFLFKTLLELVPVPVAIWTLLIVYFGTNLLYYSTIEANMTHVFSFGLIGLFLWLTIQWYRHFSWTVAVQLGLVGGLIVLIRPVNALVALVFLVYGMASIKGIQAYLRFLTSHGWQVLLMLFAALLVQIPQLLYWHWVTGQLLFYSYGSEEGFFFGSPKVGYGLFSFRKGWWVYTPLMGLSLLGIPFMSKFLKAFQPALLLLFPLVFWVTFSWWCWWYGGGYSCRPMVDFYALFALPIAGFFDWGWKRWNRSIKTLVVGGVLLLTGLNLFQTYQRKRNTIHYDSMTRQTYLMVWGKLKKPAGFQQSLLPPDYDRAMRGEDEYRWGEGPKN